MNKRIITRFSQLALCLLTVFTTVSPVQGLAQTRSVPSAEILTQHSPEPEVLSEAASPAPVSSTAPNWASVPQQDVAAEIISVAVDPTPVSAGEQAAFTVTVRNTGTTIWDPTGIEAEVIVIDEYGAQLATGRGADAVPFEAVALGADVSVIAYLQTPRDWQGTYGYTVNLWYLSTLMDSYTGESALLEVNPADGPIEADEDGAFQWEEHLMGIGGGGGQTADIVFAIDTSGSMHDEFSELCSKIDDVVAGLQGRGITVRYRILGITSNYLCTDGYVTNLIPGATSDHSEDWGPATYDLSYGYDWAPGYVRLIIPMSDEGPENGNGCYDPGDDRDSITMAIAAAQANNVRVAPVIGSGYNACVETLAQDLAYGTGGTLFYSTDPSGDLADGIATIVQTAVKPDPKGEQGPLVPSAFDSLFSNDPEKAPDNGAKDEGFTWVHPAVTFDPQGNAQCDEDCLTELRISYHEYMSGTLPIEIPITRYYGKTDSNNHLEQNVIQNTIVTTSTKIGILIWDSDRLEEISLLINGDHRLRCPLSDTNNDWSYQYCDVPVDYLLFPSEPGSPSDEHSYSNPDPGPLTPATNTITIDFDPPYKTLIAGVRLVVKGVRPIVLVPGFGSGASNYNWGEVENKLKGKYDLIVERPCDYEWHFNWWLGEYLPEEHHWRCFERVHRWVPGTGTLRRNRWALKWTIDEIKKRYGVDKVNLVGHSKGGLFSRAYVSASYYQGDVENLVSIASPQRGGYLMDVATDMKDLPYCDTGLLDPICEFGRGELEFATWLATEIIGFKSNDVAGWEITETWVDEKLDSFNHTHRPASEVDYHSIVATAGNLDEGKPEEVDPDHDVMDNKWYLDWAFSIAYQLNYYADNPNRGQSDILIPTPSQRIGNIDSAYMVREESCTVIRRNHDTSRLDEDAAHAIAKALGLTVSFSGLLGCSGVADPQTAAVSRLAATAVATDAVQSLAFSDRITYGQSVDVPFVVDGSYLGVFGLWDGDGTVSLELTDSAGTPITPTAATGDDNIGYEGLQDPSAGFGYARYIVTDTVKGTWTAHIIAPDTGPASDYIWWQLLVSQRSPISFTVSTTPTVYPLGVPVTLRSYPVTGTVPITGANIQAEIKGQTGITQSVTLPDDGFHDDLAAGDGVYGVQVTPSQPDFYEVSASMTGTLPSGVSYVRQDKTFFTVLPSSAHFSDVYDDVGTDEDDDGLYDNLRIEVGVTLDQDGQYTLIGTLSTPAGTELGTASNAVSDTAGSNVTMTLDFDASLLVNRSADGPVVLSELLLMDQSVDLRTDYLENAYTTTQSYSPLDFSGWEARLAGSLNDQGVDTNSNGKFEVLEVGVPLEIRRPGTYTATAVLELSSGDTVIGPQSVFFVTLGVDPVTATLQFSGPTIAVYAVDGPYTVTNMMLEGPLGLALMKHVVGHTAAYSYLDFEADTVTPTSTINPLPAVITGTPIINLTWSGSDPDPSAGIAFYNVQYKVGSAGVWTDWITETVLTNYSFGPFDPITVTSGITYYFQVRAYDYAGNQEAYPGGDGDTHTTMVGVDMQTSKSASGQFIQGYEGIYTIDYQNRGPLPSFNVVLTDTLPTGLIYVSDNSGITPTLSGNQVAWYIGTVPGYANRSFDLTVYVTPTLVGGEAVTNTLDILASSMEHNTTNNGSFASTVIISATRDMHVSKFLYSGSPFAGDDIEYRIYYQNSGNSDAADVVITDTLPLSMTYVSSHNNEGFTLVVNGDTVVWTKPVVPNGDSGYLYLTVHIDESAPENSTLTNTVRIANSFPETTYTNNVYTHTATVIAHTRDMHISKYKYSGTVVAGAEVKYRIQFANQGNSDAADVIITDTLPVSTTYVSDQNSYGFTTVVTGSIVVWANDTVAANSSGYIYLTVRVNDDVAGDTLLTNTVAVATSDIEADYSDNVYTYTLTAETPTVDMYVSKWLDEGNATPGNNLTYEIYYRNYGNSPAADVVITDTLPVSTTYLSFSGSYTPTLSGNQLTWNLGTVPGSGYSGYYGYLHVTVHLSEKVPIGIVLTNTAGIATSSPETDYGDNSDLDTRTVITGTPDLRLYKYFENSQAPQGSEVTYRLNYYNYDYDAAVNVVLTDTLPLSTTYVSSTGGPEPVVNGNQVVWHLSSIPGRYQLGYQGDIYLTVYIPESVPLGTVLTNTAVITTLNDTNLTNNVDDDVHTVVAATRDLYVDKTLYDGTALPGNDLTYRIYYRNYGNAHLPGTIITDTLPAGTTFVSASGDFTPTVAGNTVVWRLGTVPGYYAPGYSGYLYVTVHIPDDIPPGTVLRNRAEGTTSATETGTHSNWDEYASTVQAHTRDLRVYKSHYSGTPVGGSDITYRLRVYNDGNSPAVDVHVTDTLPVSATYVSWSGDTRFTLVSTANGQVVWTTDELPGGFSSDYIYLTVHLDEGLPSDVELSNHLEVSTSDVETDYGDNVTTHSMQSVAEGQDVKVTKNWSGGSPLPDHTLTYRLDYVNLGIQSASNVVITDTLPLSTTFYSTYASGWNYTVNGRVITWTRSSLYGQYSGYINLTVYISDTVPAGTVLTNTATISSSDVDANPANNVATYVIPVASGSRDMYIDKTLSSGSAAPGLELIYRLYYRNYGSDPASTAIITDTLPDGLSYVSASGSFTPTVVGNQVVWHLGTVPGQYNSGYYGYLYLTVRVGDAVPVGTVLYNVAEITTADQETGFYSNLDTYALTVQPPPPAPALSIAKSDAPDPVQAGDLLTYTIVVQNIGSADATDVIITDTLPANTTFVSADSGGGLVVGQVRWTGKTVPVGGILTVTFVVTVDSQLTNGTILRNDDYSVTCAEGESASGEPVTTAVGEWRICLPIVMRNHSFLSSLAADSLYGGDTRRSR